MLLPCVAVGSGIPATAGVRDPSREAPKNAALAALPGVALAAADMGKLPTNAAWRRVSLESGAMAIPAGAVVFINTPGHEDRASLVASAVAAAVAAQAGHIVVVSLPVVTVEKSTIFGDQFKAIEATVKGCGIPFTLVRLPMFMDNHLGQPLGEASAMFMPLKPHQVMSAISLKDIGCGVANILRSPAQFAGRTITLGGVRTTMAKTAAAYSRVLSRPVRFTQVPPAAAKESMMGAGWPECKVMPIPNP
jgi:uncharacterized protein YbjT (DUF2867 family)